MESYIIILMKVENRMKKIFGEKISSWIIQELLILLINWVLTLQTLLNPRWCDGSTWSFNSMENMMLIFYWRILKGIFTRFLQYEWWIIAIFYLVSPSEVFFITSITKEIWFVSIRTATLCWLITLFQWGIII